MRRVLALAAVVAGVFALPSAASALPAGSFDPSFGGGTGLTIPDVVSGAEDAPNSAVVDSQGRTVELDGQSATCAVIPFGCASNDVHISRFNNDGTPDTTFGTGGITTVAHDSGVQYSAIGLGLQSDGRIVVAYFNRSSTKWDVRRFDSGGMPDATFAGGAGKYELSSGVGPLTGMALDGDRILLAGPNSTATGSAVARLTKDGQADPTWHAGTPATIDYGAAALPVEGVAAAADHKVVVVGSVIGSGGHTLATAARLDSAGVLDPDFGTGGKKAVDFANIWFPSVQVSIAPDGGVAFAGTLHDATNNILTLTKLTPHGNLDNDFSGDGQLTQVLGPIASPTFALALLRRADGSFLVGGTNGTLSPPVSTLRGFVYAYTDRGVVDNAFSGDGQASITSSNPLGIDGVFSLAPGPEGRVVTVGPETDFTLHTKTLLSRLLVADDNCPLVSNPDQADLDGDGLGDACDDDIDGDGLPNTTEAAIGTNPLVTDSDGDGKIDGADACPTHAGAEADGCPAPTVVRVTGDTAGGGGGGGGGQTTTPVDKTPAKLGFTIASKLKRATFLKKGLSFKLASDEPVSVSAQLIGTLKGVHVARAGDLILAEKNLPLGGGSRTITFKLGAKQKKLIGKTAKLTVVVTAFDASGNRTVASKKLTIK